MSMLPSYPRHQIHCHESANGSVPRSLGLGLDMPVLQLLHHFDRHTASTLAFGTSVWRDNVLPLALHNEILMHAILTISASHQHSISPDNSTYTKAMAYHLDLTLSGFRGLLSQGTENCNHDVVIACSLLLVHYAWSMPFFAYADDKIDMRSEPDKLLKFSAGLKAVIITMKEDNGYYRGIFKSPMSNASIQAFQDWESALGTTFDFGDFFFGARSTALEGSFGCCNEHGCADPYERLAPLLNTMDAVLNGHAIHHLMLQIRIYTLFWPSKASRDFENAFSVNQTEACVVMLTFYATAWWLLSESVWWARRRTKVMCESILESLDKNNKNKRWQANIEHVRQYFKFTPNGAGGWTIGDPGYHPAEY
ncbi:hypothetical protein TRIATDRAFT_318487 [Trichoderma atroviride IMI 206040]|uniref:Uncharacterized protein n=1 Tax=Hypocrea atroviridis (strain ATCC 20476 / IMI 206040) TaxID=452589 RepID=G9NV98_HYPAI|nr:uncharacterized protein TRIATDRAFT_318487 [Trichoderma atroviride IMI 206040]EHK44919.1 hypothetical protein TRIATDRAFT_318487 [Trichoderma atroviride IMI 206040]